MSKDMCPVYDAREVRVVTGRDAAARPLYWKNVILGRKHPYHGKVIAFTAAALKVVAPITGKRVVGLASGADTRHGRVYTTEIIGKNSNCLSYRAIDVESKRITRRTELLKERERALSGLELSNSFDRKIYEEIDREFSEKLAAI